MEKVFDISCQHPRTIITAKCIRIISPKNVRHIFPQSTLNVFNCECQRCEGGLTNIVGDMTKTCGEQGKHITNGNSKPVQMQYRQHVPSGTKKPHEPTQKPNNQRRKLVHLHEKGSKLLLPRLDGTGFGEPEVLIKKVPGSGNSIPKVPKVTLYFERTLLYLVFLLKITIFVR